MFFLSVFQKCFYWRPIGDKAILCLFIMLLFFPAHQAFRVWALPGSSNSLYVLLFLIMSDLNVICFKNSSLAYFTMTHLLFNSYHNLKLFLYVYILVYFLSFPLHTCISDLISFNDQLSFLFYFLPHPVICGILVP